MLPRFLFRNKKLGAVQFFFGRVAEGRNVTTPGNAPTRRHIVECTPDTISGPKAAPEAICAYWMVVFAEKTGRWLLGLPRGRSGRLNHVKNKGSWIERGVKKIHQQDIATGASRSEVKQCSEGSVRPCQGQGPMCKGLQPGQDVYPHPD